MAVKPVGLSRLARFVGGVLAVSLFADLIWGDQLKAQLPPLLWYGLWGVWGALAFWWGNQFDAANREIKRRRNT